jgi:8-oxo-dGTP pyrophosphatase MutT (NUDIX family)
MTSSSSGPSEWPPPGSVIHRTTARVLPVDPDGRVLLLHGWDPARPDEPFWFTIGGAADEGESLQETAARELREEAGISVLADRLGEPLASNTIEFPWGGWKLVQGQTFFAVAVESADVSFAGQDEWERSTIDKHAWLTAEEVLADPDPVHPQIPELMAAAVTRLRGQGPS